MPVAPETLACQGIEPFVVLPCELIPADREGDGQAIPLTATSLITLKMPVDRFKIPFALSVISPAHGARRYQESGAVLSGLNDFYWR